MRRARPLIALLWLLLAAAVPDDGRAWSEVALRSSPAGEVATCLRDGGAGGLVQLLGPLERRSSPMDVLSVSDGAIDLVGRVALGISDSCPEIAAGEQGTVVVAGQVRARGLRVPLRVTVADPGGPFSAPRTLGAYAATDVDVAVAPSGAAVVAWAEILPGRGRLPRTNPFRPRGAKLRVFAARRRPGEPFGAPELVAAGPSGGFAGGEVSAGIDASGAVTLVWPRSLPSRDPIRDLSAIAASSAPPGGRFGAPQVLAASVQEVGEPSLAVAPNGGAIVAHSGNSRLHVYERRAGEDSFAKTATLGRGQELLSKPTVSMRDGGGAVLAWQANGLRGGYIATATRESVGVFGAPREVARFRPVDTGISIYLIAPNEPAFPPPDEGNLALRSALAPDGRFVLSWGGTRRLPFRDRPLAVRAATGILGQAPSPARTLGCPCRTANGAVPFVLPGLGPAVAWTDNRTEPSFRDSEYPAGGGRLHVYVRSGRTPASPAPRLTLRARRGQGLRWGQPLLVRASCDRACDLRALIPRPPRRPRSLRGLPPREIGRELVRRQRARGLRGLGTASLANAGTTVLRVAPPPSGQLVPRTPAPLRVVVRAYAPGTGAFTARKLVVNARRRRVPPVPVPQSVRARRRGRTITVRWEMRAPARRVDFRVEPLRTERPRSVLFRRVRHVEGAGRRHFVARVRLGTGDRVRYVAVVATRRAAPFRSRRAIAPVT
jgi:hypothetical protein